MIDSLELHDLDSALGEWLYTRIREYRQVTRRCPDDLTPELWDEILYKIEKAAALLVNPDDLSNDERQAEITAGLSLLAAYALELWF